MDGHYTCWQEGRYVFLNDGKDLLQALIHTSMMLTPLYSWHLFQHPHDEEQPSISNILTTGLILIKSQT